MRDPGNEVGTSLQEKLSPSWTNQVSKTIPTARQFFAQCPALMKSLNEACKTFT